MIESFQPENSGSARGNTSESEPVPLDKTREALRQLPQETWLRLSTRISRRFHYLTGKTIYSPEDLIQEAVLRLFNGTRRWYAKHDLETTLMGTAKSVANQYYEVIKGRPEDRERTVSGATHQGGAETTEPLSPADEEELSGEDTYPQARIQEEVSAEIRASIFKCVENDPLLTQVVRYWLEHPDAKPRELAPAVGINIEAFRNLQKRLRRQLAELKGWRKELA